IDDEADEERFDHLQAGCHQGQHEDDADCEAMRPQPSQVLAHVFAAFAGLPSWDALKGVPYRVALKGVPYPRRAAVVRPVVDAPLPVVAAEILITRTRGARTFHVGVTTGS